MATTALTTLLGIAHPIVQGPFGGGLSSVALAATVSDAGGLGSFGANHLEPDAVAQVVTALRAATDRPFAVNLWVPHESERDAHLDEAEFERQIGRLRPYFQELDLPLPTYPPKPAPRFAAQAEALLAAAPPVVSFVMGVPPGDILAEARRQNIVTIGTATTVAEAVALQDAGVDAIVASGSDAGGHRGAFLRPVELSLVGTFSLVPQVVDAVSVPVIAAGGVADARGVAAALALGASGVQVGTAFLGTAESGASAVHKAALHGPQGRTTVLTRAFTGRLARAIPNRLSHELAAVEHDLAPYPIHGALTAPIRAAGNQRGLADFVHLWSGQAAGLTRPRPAAELLAELATGVR